VRHERRLARNAQCRGRLSQLGLALRNFAEDSGEFPPLASRDDKGRPLLSWRALLLPYLDGTKVFDDLDQSEAWDSPNNLEIARRASSSIGNRFRSPNDVSRDGNSTSFIAIDFSSSDFPKGHKGGRRIIVVEVHDSGINWMEPRDLPFDEIQARVVEMVERGEVVHVLTADGNVGTILNHSLVFYGSVDQLFKEWSTQE
jgi:hypothetical protein